MDGDIKPAKTLRSWSNLSTQRLLPSQRLFFLVVTLVLPCFGGDFLENGTETQTQEQYSTVNNIKDEIIFGNKGAGATWLHSFSEQESWIQLVRG
jgi:hypothetical protein